MNHFYDNIYFYYYSSGTPLKSIIDTPLTDSLVNEIFHQQNSVKLYFGFLILIIFFFLKDGSFPATEQFGKLFNVDYEEIKRDLKEKGLASSSK